MWCVPIFMLSYIIWSMRMIGNMYFFKIKLGLVNKDGSIEEGGHNNE